MRRANPWPAFVDLFAALLIAAFGGLMLLSAADHKKRDEGVTASKVRTAADAIDARLRQAIGHGRALGGRVRKCGEDTCIDLYIHFPRNKAYVTNATERRALQELGRDLRDGLDQLPNVDRGDVEVIVEGHADRSQVVHLDDPREAFLYNWDLSARRASSVVYEFRTIGLQPPEYKVVAIGYADSQPLCHEHTPQCEEKNRRTTLRLRIDTRSLEMRLKTQLNPGAPQ